MLATDIDIIRRRLEAEDRFVPAAVAPAPRAAVAILLVLRDVVHIVFIKKQEHEGYDWSGHLAFPGGRCDGTDETPLATALRELDEELGLPTDAVTPLATLGTFQTQFRNLYVEAFVMIWRGTDALRPSSDEIAWVREVPLDHFLAVHRERRYGERPYADWGLALEYPLGDDVVWGLSARMLHTLLERLEGDGAC